MKEVSLSIKDLLGDDKKLTFLVGAGCSIDPPSCLADGFKMMKSIINYTCDQSEIENVLDFLNSGKLRFEALVEIIRDHLDNNLKIIDYYNQCNKPNIQHFYLANMIKKGQFVMTTNFDFLIEYALLNLDINKNDIIIVITDSDFKQYYDPNVLINQGKKPLYKIHGSTTNIIKEEDTRKYLITTIQDFGSNKEGLNIFQVEPFKRPLFDNISKNRSIVVLGYSGSDDFDIVPTLKVLKNVKNVIWINFVRDDKGIEKIYEIEKDISSTSNNRDKVNQILLDIRRMSNSEHVYRVDTNTSRMIKELIDFKPNLSSENFTLNPMDWLKNNIEIANEISKFYIPYKIFFNSDRYDDALRCANKMLNAAKRLHDQSAESLASNGIGEIYRKKGNYTEALKYYKDALKINEKIKDLPAKAINYINIAAIYTIRGNYRESLNLLEEALKINEELGNLKQKATCLNNISEIYFLEGKHSEALKLLEESLKINEELGNLKAKAALLNNIGEVYRAQRRYNNALKHYRDAIQIFEQIESLRGNLSSLSNMGKIFYLQGKYVEAMNIFEDILNNSIILGDLSRKAIAHNYIGMIYQVGGYYSKALNHYNNALKIFKQDDLLEKSKCLNNIGSIYKIQGLYSEALKQYEEALIIVNKLGNVEEKSTTLNNIGDVYLGLKDYSKALKMFEDALKLTEKLEYQAEKAFILNNLGTYYFNKTKYNKALDLFKEALNIASEYDNQKLKVTILGNIGTIYFKKGKSKVALNSFEEALQILNNLGLGTSNEATQFRDNIQFVKNHLK
jgi:tetratricopeptide (TPR) repeat protein